jgi:hypothetical protein
MARIFKRLGSEGLDMLLPHAMLPELRIQTKAREELRHGGNGVPVGFGVRGTYYLKTTRNSNPPIEARLALGA